MDSGDMVVIGIANLDLRNADIRREAEIECSACWRHVGDDLGSMVPFSDEDVPPEKAGVREIVHGDHREPESINVAPRPERYDVA